MKTNLFWESKSLTKNKRDSDKKIITIIGDSIIKALNSGTLTF